MKKIVIVSAVRTPMGSFLGALSPLTADKLGAVAIKGAIDRIGLAPDQVDEVFMGNVLQAGLGQAPARQAALRAELAAHIPCTTINKVCASGLKAIMLGAQAIALGEAQVVVAGGMESMSNVPHYAHMRKGHKFGTAEMVDGIAQDGLTDAYDHKLMGVFADEAAKTHAFSREAQDKFSIESYQRAATAWGKGYFAQEIVPVSIPQRKADPIIFSEDEEYKQVNFDKIPQLRAAFVSEGTVTAANSSTMNDGAAAIVLMSEEKAKKLNLTPLVTIVSWADAAHEPKWFTTAPTTAIQKALNKVSLTSDQIDFYELNEAFAVVGLLNMKLLNISPQKTNVHGGAVALGHPLGCSGARILISLIHILNRYEGTYGAAGICNGGGGASAMIIKRA